MDSPFPRSSRHAYALFISVEVAAFEPHDQIFHTPAGFEVQYLQNAEYSGSESRI